MSIVYYPEEILLNPTSEVNLEEYGFENLKKLKDEMVSEMISLQGIGLAANQIGYDKRIFVMYLPQSSASHQSIMLVNPKIIRSGKDKISIKEGCLSFPDVQVEKQRNKIVTVQYFDENGVAQERVFKGIEAVCVQHEIDHLDGKTFIDDLSMEEKHKIIEKIKDKLNKYPKRKM